VLYCLANSRTEEQRADMVRLEEAGLCLFCPEVLRAEHEVLHETAHWTVTPNRFPYRGTALHLLVVPKEHVTDLLDLSVAAQADYWPVLSWVRDRFGLTHYGLAARNGDCAYTGGTISHVHVHVLVGDVEDPDHQPVRVRLSSRPAPAPPR
jgi:ATP adenylyltransferase